MRTIVSGGAPLAPHVEEFLKVVMCAPVVQGYGLTETCAASFIAAPDDIRHAGSVGLPQPVTTFCLESVPEMKYDSSAMPPRGELLMKGPSNFLGYYKMDDKTVCCVPRVSCHSVHVALRSYRMMRSRCAASVACRDGTA